MKYKIFAVLFLPLFAFTCVSKKNFITVENKINTEVYCIPSYNYPDTSLSFTEKNQILANDSFFYVRPFVSKKLFFVDLCKIETWKKLIKSDSIQIFVFDEKVLKEKSWNEIVTGKLYLRRLTYSYKDIVDNGCKIVVQ